MREYDFTSKKGVHDFYVEHEDVALRDWLAITRRMHKFPDAVTIEDVKTCLSISEVLSQTRRIVERALENFG